MYREHEKCLCEKLVEKRRKGAYFGVVVINGGQAWIQLVLVKAAWSDEIIKMSQNKTKNK